MHFWGDWVRLSPHLHVSEIFWLCLVGRNFLFVFLLAEHLQLRSWLTPPCLLLLLADTNASERKSKSRIPICSLIRIGHSPLPRCLKCQILPWSAELKVNFPILIFPSSCQNFMPFIVVLPKNTCLRGAVPEEGAGYHWEVQYQRRCSSKTTTGHPPWKLSQNTGTVWVAHSKAKCKKACINQVPGFRVNATSHLEMQLEKQRFLVWKYILKCTTNKFWIAFIPLAAELVPAHDVIPYLIGISTMNSPSSSMTSSGMHRGVWTLHGFEIFHPACSLTRFHLSKLQCGLLSRNPSKACWRMLWPCAMRCGRSKRSAMARAWTWSQTDGPLI